MPRARPLLECELIHSLPGRVRVGCRALRYLQAHAATIEAEIGSIPAIHFVRVTTLTANVLVRFDVVDSTPEQVVSWVEGAIAAHSSDAYKADRMLRTQTTVNERRLQDEPLSDMARRVAFITGSLLLFWLRRGGDHIHVPLSRRLLTVPSLTSLFLGAPIFRSGAESLARSGRPNADTLSSTAILASLLAGRDISALTIIWLADIAELLTAYTMHRTRRAIREMLSVGEEYVWRIAPGGAEERVPITMLRHGDEVFAVTGEKISVDGPIVAGEAAVDEASITGEFMPKSKSVGDTVFAGTVVRTGRLTVRAEKVGDETAVARIIHLVEEASSRKATVQGFADRFSASLIPLNLALAAVVYAVTRRADRALNMLIIDYSCGVRLSTATALSAAICTAARNGILVKGGNVIEALAEADTVVMDKTGTLTEGKPEVSRIVPARQGIDERAIVESAAAAEETSTHPTAAAILDHVRRSGWRVPKHTESLVHPGLGVETRVGRAVVRVGGRRMMVDNGVDIGSTEAEAGRLLQTGNSVVYVARGKTLLGILGIQDRPRENMRKALNRLRQAGVDEIVLLTGDLERHAETVATKMAMDRYEAEALPEDKALTVLKLQARGAPVVMVGDGVNDAPALAYADVGIAMGGRTDIAMEAADITIVRDDPLMIPAAFRLAQKTMGVVRENFAVAVGVNTLGLVTGAMGLLPVFWGAVLHNATTVAVVLNSSRLLIHDVEASR
jgi:cation-transporting P-type ATPase C